MSASLQAKAIASTRVASLLPAWNPGERLDRTLSSIAAQDIPCEIFLVDDGSVPALRPPSRAGSHPIHLIRLERNEGIASALNAGLAQIMDQGFDYVARHDVGDVDVADRLSRQVAFLNTHPEIVLVGSSAEFYSEGGELFTFKAPVGDDAIRRQMCYSAALVHSTCMFRPEALREMGRYSESDDCAEDYELFFRMNQRFKLENLPEVLVRAEYNIDGISISRRRQSLVSRLRLQWRFFEPRCLHSYLGVLQTALLFVAPIRLVALIKRALRRGQHIGVSV